VDLKTYSMKSEITLRDYFAGKAMLVVGVHHDLPMLASRSYAIADAMIAARGKE